MSTLALLLVLCSAFLHASWNFLAKRAGGGVPFTWLFSAAATVMYAPFAVVLIVIQRPHLGPIEIVFIAGSAVLHIGYFLLLQRGYTVGDLSLVYPLARGTGPMLATVFAVLLFGERPSPVAIAGAVMILAGVFMLTGGTRLFSGAANRVAIGYGLMTGTFIAAYTLWDKYAVSVLLMAPLFYDWLNNAGRALMLTPPAVQKWEAVRHEWRTHRLAVLGVAALSPLAYILVLTAMTFTPVSYVAPVREFSILIGTAMGARLLSEGEASRRLAAAGVMALGVIALALG